MYDLPSYNDTSFDDGSVSSEASGKLVNGSSNRPNSSDSNGLEAGDRHGRLLLAALLENFCRLYEADSKKAERLFSVLCKTLSAMGILDQENVDELAGVRSHYSKAFKNLMIQAKDAVDREDGRPALSSRRSIRFEQEPSLAGSLEDDTLDVASAEHSDIFSITSSGARLSLSDWLGFEDTKYHAEFEELGTLGRGGFGAVYRVRNKIDEREYAVKKIVMKRASSNQAKIYREIKTLARLEHPNIIRYFSSWLEHSASANHRKPRSDPHRPFLDQQMDDMLFPMDQEEPSFSSNNATGSAVPDDSYGVIFEPLRHNGRDAVGHEDEEDDNLSAMSFSHSRAPGTSIHDRKVSQSSGDTASSVQSGSTVDIFQDPETSSLPTARYRSQSLSKSIEEIPRHGNHSLFSMSMPHTHSKFNRQRRKSEAGMCLTLFIQMHLCPTTLRDHIKQRNAVYCQKSSPLKDKISSRTYIDLFRSILEGAKYVHRSGLCHRDIKPSNIFLAEAEDVGRGAVDVLDPQHGAFRPVVPKLGDFGLVLPTGHDNRDDIEDEDGVGTAMYGAPEQFLRSKANLHHMTSKCDVFALGIVFFEMLHYSSTTAMERAKLLTDLRNGVLPEEFVQQNPAEAAIILAMTCHDPGKRPSVEEILEMEILISGEEKEKDRELKRMQLENEALKRRIRELEEFRAS